MVNARTAIAMAALLVGVGSAQDAPRVSLNDAAVALERVDEGYWETLQRVPDDQRNDLWQHLAALACVARGELDDAARRARDLVNARSSATALLMERFLLVHGHGSGSERPFPSAWRDNPSLSSALALQRWTSRRLGTRIAELSYLLKIEHHGPWLTPLPDSGDLRFREPVDAREGLEWLNRGRDSLLVRLSGSRTSGPFGGMADGGRWLLVTLLRSGTDLSDRARASRRLGELLGVNTPVQLWIVEAPLSETRDWRTELARMTTPLFVATTRSGASQVPGFERGDVTLLVDPRLRLRLVADRWLPLPVLHRMMERIITGE